MGILKIEHFFNKHNLSEAMKELKCEHGVCTTTLSSPSEIATGLCVRHYKMLIGRHHYVVVCWECNKIHNIRISPIQGGIKLYKDKYIFTRACPSCDKTSDGDRWMNHPSSGELSEVVLGMGMTLHPGPYGLTSGPKKKNSHINPRRSTATGDPFVQGQDVITKIKLSRAQSNQELESFLSDLDLTEEGDEHGEESHPSEF